MQFVNNAPVYKLVRVTGPTHNLLILRLSSRAITGPVRVDVLDELQNCSNPIDAHEILQKVLLAVRDWESESGKTYFLEEIQYLASDSRPVDVYYEMTKEILKRIEMQSNQIS